MTVRRKCFLSYHRDDYLYVDDFTETFEGSFISKAVVMPNDIIKSDDPDYVMRRIREVHLKDSTVTIVLVGNCTWARRYVDWEVQASLRRVTLGPPPNGLLAIPLRPDWTTLPERVLLNVGSGYAKFYGYPRNTFELSNMVEEAFQARTTKAAWIENPRERYTYNRSCV